jgi:hypothetical protein
MPNIRVMNWNIERLSVWKTGIAGMAANFGKIIVQSQADIVILLEVTAGTGIAAMTAISNAANAASVAFGGNVNDYTGWLLSYSSGGECYGVLIKNLNQVRPVRVITRVGFPTGTDFDPLVNLDETRFATWPAPFLGPGAVVNAYPAPALAMRPSIPLIDVYSSPPRPRAVRQRGRFAGRRLDQGGYALGRGFRMPCLAMFEILNNAGTATYVVPILTCHLGAVRGGTNRLARGQIRQYKDIHISQKFQNPVGLLMPYGGYIDLNNAARPIQELIITGDFNVDFLQQAPPAAANALRTGNRAAWNTVTPTTTNGGSAAPPAALPGPPFPYAAMPPHAALPAPVAPFFVFAGPPGPDFTTINDQTLKTANTTQGTILIDYNALGPVPPNVAALRGAAFDNFFFGGTQLSATYQALTPLVADAAAVHDVPSLIVQPGAVLPGNLEVSGAWTYHMIPPITRNAPAAPNLGPAAPLAALTTNDRLIGSRFISDHLPVIVQFNLP